MIGRFLDSEDGVLRYETEDGTIVPFKGADVLGQWKNWMADQAKKNSTDLMKVPGCALAGAATGNFDESLFWDIQALIALGYSQDKIFDLDVGGVTIKLITNHDLHEDSKVVYWDRSGSDWPQENQDAYGDPPSWWLGFPALAQLAHEVEHGWQDIRGEMVGYVEGSAVAQNAEQGAMVAENSIAYAFYKKVPGYQGIPGPRTYFNQKERTSKTGNHAKYSAETLAGMTWEQWEKKVKEGWVPEY